MVCASVSQLYSAAVPVPNASFESPTTPFVSVVVDDWQKSPKPDWYQESGGFLWDQLVGIFKNPPPDSLDHIVNCDGAQAAWLFAVPDVAMFLDRDAAPASGFDARFEPGQSYRLTVGIIGTGGNMLDGVPLELGVYYRDDAGEPVTVAATVVTNSAAVLGDRTRFQDFSVRVPEVEPGDGWAGKAIGIRFRSLVSLAMQGGFWDLDQVRLESFARPLLEEPAWNAGQFEVVVVSAPGDVIELLTSPEVTAPVAEWKPLGTLTNETGRVRFTDPHAGDAARLYQARVVP